MAVSLFWTTWIGWSQSIVVFARGQRQSQSIYVAIKLRREREVEDVENCWPRSRTCDSMKLSRISTATEVRLPGRQSLPKPTTFLGIFVDRLPGLLLAISLRIPDTGCREPDRFSCAGMISARHRN